MACKENPHADVMQCEIEGAVCVLDILCGVLDPVTVMANASMILPGAAESLAGTLAITDNLTAKNPAEPEVRRDRSSRFCPGHWPGAGSTGLASGSSSHALICSGVGSQGCASSILSLVTSKDGAS